MPIRFDIFPTTIVIPLVNSQSVLVMTNAAVTTPDPTGTSMKPMTIMVPSNQVPVPSDDNPTTSGPPFQQALPVKVVTNSPVTAPEPPARFVVMVPLPQVPIGTHASPVALIVAEQCSQTVQMHTNTPEASPSPLRATMQAMIVMVTAPKMPV